MEEQFPTDELISNAARRGWVDEQKLRDRASDRPLTSKHLVDEGHLTAAQVYDALSYYHDHQVEIDQLLEESQPERVIAAQGLKVEKVAEGMGAVHDETGRW